MSRIKGKGRGNIFGSLGFRLIGASLALAFICIALGGVAVFKLSEDAIKRDAQDTAEELAQRLTSVKPSEGNKNLFDAILQLKVEKTGSAWVMDREGFLIAHIDPRLRERIDEQQNFYIGDREVDLNVVKQPLRQLGEKNVVHKARFQDLIERYDAGFGTFNTERFGVLPEDRIFAFNILKDRGWLVAIDQPISSAFSELDRIKKTIITASLTMAILVTAFTWFAMRIIIQPFYREQEATNIRLETMNTELESSRRKLERSSNSLNRLYDLSIAMQYSGFLESHLPLVLGVAQERFEVDRILLMMPDDEGKMLRCRASVGNVFESEEKIAVPLPWGEGGAMARVFHEKRTVFMDGSTPLPQEMRLAPPYDQIRSLRTRVFAVVPLMAKEHVLGVLAFDNKMSRRPLTKDDIEAIETFGQKVAQLIDNTRHFQSIRKAAHELEIRDRLTGLFHLRHVREIGEEHIQNSTRGHVPLSAALFYLSNFKEYNELNGYQRGDFVLQKTAELLKGQEVMGVVPSRCYGATFLALYPGKTGDQARYLVEQTVKEFQQFSFYGEKKLTDGRLVPTVSVAEYSSGSGKTFDEFYAGLEST